MKKIAEQDGIYIAVLPFFTLPDHRQDKRRSMIQREYTDDSSHNGRRLIAVADLFRYASGVNAVYIHKTIKHHAHNAKA